MKLHLGCGGVYLEGWQNIDISPHSKADSLDDVSTLKSIDTESCDIIYASHVLEHFDRSEYVEVLSVWQQKLKVGGLLRLAVPNIQAALSWYNGSNLNELLGIFYGGQSDPYDYHKMGFDKHTLSTKLKELGFKDIKLWDWRDTDHADIDDYSQSFLPHMKKDSGTLMSLNLEATK
jgi:predicted SAM-dependent methyltransferase